MKRHMAQTSLSGNKRTQTERGVRIAGMGRALAGEKITFGNQTRYRLSQGQSLLDLAEKAANEALSAAGMNIKDMDLIVCAMATPLQAIPCNGALIHERMAKDWIFLPWISTLPAPALSLLWISSLVLWIADATVGC